MRIWIVVPRPFVSVLTFFAVLVMPAYAGPNRWSTSSLGLASVARLIPDPSDATRLYAVTTGGSVLKSTDSGLSWRSTNQGLASQSISAFLIEPDSTATLFAATDGVIFTSTDAAGHWSKAGTVDGNDVLALAFEPTSRQLFAGTAVGLYVSADNGKTWSNTALRGVVTTLVVSPKSTILAAVQRHGLYASKDHGRTWSVLRTGNFGIVAVDQNSTIYWFREGEAQTDSDQVSSDEGATWHNLPPITYHPPRVSSGDVTLDNANITVAAPGDLFLLGQQNLFEYTDRSGAWLPVGPLITNGSPLSMAIVPSQPRKFLVSTTAGGLLMSDGADWTHVTNGFCGARANDVAVVASNPSIAVAATDGGVFRTEDHGADWKEITPAGPKPSTAVQVDPNRTDVVYASTDKVYKSTDSGSSWKGVNTNPAKFLLVSPTDSATIYAALADELAKSPDSGESWLSAFKGLGNYAFAYYGGAVAIDEDPSNGNTLYIAAGDGALYRLTADLRWTWVFTQVDTLAVAPHEAVVYAARDPGGVFKTYDRGTTWTSLGLIDKRIRALLLTGSSRNVLYAASTDGHVYRTTDDGNIWQGVDTALDRSPIMKLASDPSGKFLYAASGTVVSHYEVSDIQVGVLASDALRLPRLLNEATGNSMVILPIAGTVTGALGTVYTTDITLANGRDSAQDVIVSWLSQAGGNVTSFHLTLPPSSDATTNGVLTIPDFVGAFGISGVGSLVIAGVDSKGDPDPSATITASADIWSHPPDQRAPFAQTVSASPRQAALAHTQAEITGLQQDAAFRTNVGVANLSAQTHSYLLTVSGERTTNAFAMTIPPFSSSQLSLPAGDYGALTITITADASTDWVAYGSTIDRATGEARTIAGH
jgi:photosystem II stability/assembly factor-like uncharacterized protein